MTKTTLLRSASFGAVLAVGLGASAAQAADQADCTTKCVAPHHHRHHVVKEHVESPLVGEVAALKAQMAQLEQRLDASNAAAAQAQAAAAQAQAAAAAAQASASADDLAIKQIPGDVTSAVAALPKPKTDALYIKGVKLTLGGFIAAESIYRSHNMEQDISSSYGAIPFTGNNGEPSGFTPAGTSTPTGVISPVSATHTGHVSEFRETARQSRVSGLAEGNITDTIHVQGYGEFDFQGAAQTANSNESNSYNPRIRHLYTNIDWDSYGLHLLAGQNWSLVTLNSKGITPRAEVTPLSIEAQYVPGFDWARQPQIRLTKNWGKEFWAAISVENAQTTLYTTGAKLNNGYAVQVQGAGSSGFFAGETGLATGVAVPVCTAQNAAPPCTTGNAPGPYAAVTNVLSLNASPDVVGKLALEHDLAGHHIHAEVLGVFRSFTDRVYNGTSWANVTTSGGGVGAGLTAQVLPKILDVQVSGLYGKGIGRYGTSQLPDTFVTPSGALQGINQVQLLAGAIFHPTPQYDIYAYAGGESQYASATKTNGGAFGGFANTLNTSQVSTAGCFSELSTAACNTPTRYVEQATIGVWDRAYQGSFGRVQFGAQYSYTRRAGFNDAVNSGAPRGEESMFYTSIRYYPF